MKELLGRRYRYLVEKAKYHRHSLAVFLQDLRSDERAIIERVYLGTNFDPNDRTCTSLVDAVARNIDDMVADLRERIDEQRGQFKLRFTVPEVDVQLTE